MEIKGKVTEVFQPVGGTSKAGKPWQKQGFVIETLDDRHDRIYFETFDTNVKPQVGQTATVVYYISHREWEGKHFNDIRVWSVSIEQAQPMQSYQQPYAQPMAQPYQQPMYQQPAQPQGNVDAYGNPLPF